MTPPQQKQSWDELTRLWQPADLSSHWTTVLANRWYLVLIIAITLLHWALSGALPLSAAELYYWNWAQQLQKAYFDGPPFVAYLISFSTKLFGNSPFGIRFFAPLIGFIVLFTLGRITRGKFTLQFVLFTPLVLIFSMRMTPTTCLILFWLAYLLWLRFCCQSLTLWEADPISRVYHNSPIPISQWLLGGLALGFGLLSQYSMALALLCSFLIFSTRHRRQAWLSGYLLHLLVALMVSFPAFLYNLQEGFVPLLNQWNHWLAYQGFSLRRLILFTKEQSILVGALPFIFLPWVLLRALMKQDEASYRPHYYLYLVPLGVCFLMGLLFRPSEEILWLSWVSLIPLAQRLITTSTFRGAARLLTFLGFTPALVFSFLFLLHHSFGWSTFYPGGDEVSQARQHRTLSKQVKSKVKAKALLFAPNQEWVSQLRYEGLHAEPAYSEKDHYTINAPDPCAAPTVLYLKTGPLPNSLANCFSLSEVVAGFDSSNEHFDLILFRK